MSSKIYNTKRNIIWGLANKLSMIVLPFINRTVIIYLMGIQYVGLNGLFTSLLQVFSVAELGISSAIVYHMYRPIAIGDKLAIKKLLNFYKKIYQIIGSIILGVGLLFLPFLKYTINGDIPSELNIYVLYLLHLINTVISYFLFSYKKSLLSAYQRKDIVDKVSLFIKLFISFFQLFILFFTRDFHLYLTILIIGTVLENLLNHYWSKKEFPDIYAEGNVSDDLRKDIIEKTKGMFVYKIVGITRNSLDSLFISSFLNLTAVGQYSNYFYIMNSVKMLLDTLTQSMSASIGQSVVDSSIEKNYQNLKVFTLIYSWIAGVCAILMVILYQDFIGLWIGESGLLSFEVTVAISLYFYVWCLGDIRSQYTDATGLWFHERFRSIIEALSNIALNYLLIKSLGILGTVLATTISIFFIGNPWSTKILFENYFKNNEEWRYIQHQIYYLFITFVIGVISYNIISMIEVFNFITFALKVIVAALLVNFLYVTTFYISGEINYIKRFLGKLKS